MVRRQIQLTEEQDDALRRAAVERGLSIAALIRELVEDSLGRGGAPRATAAVRVLGRHASGRTDIAEQHDEHLEEAFGD